MARAFFSCSALHALRHAHEIRVRGHRGTRGANEIKTERARRLRRQSTYAELKLWNRLRSRAIDGHKYVRQEPIGPFVVDFVCRKRRLVIEIDGGQHATDKRDAARDQWPTERRYRVLRFWNNDVIENIDRVLERIATALAEKPTS